MGFFQWFFAEIRGGRSPEGGVGLRKGGGGGFAGTGIDLKKLKNLVIPSFADFYNVQIDLFMHKTGKIAREKVTFPVETRFLVFC